MNKPQPNLVPSRTPFDPLQYVKRLEAVGFTRPQAEEQAETFFSIIQDQSINKQDLKGLEDRTQLGFKDVRREIKELEVSLRHEMKELKADSELLRRDLKLWFGTMLVSAVVVLASLQTVIAHFMG